jgi:cyclophilin family peptidyl-prolyl cis-trans isomerase
MKRYVLYGLLLFSPFLLMSCGAKKKQEQAQKSADSLSSITEEEPKYDRTPQGNPIAVLNTTKGEIEIEIYDKAAPNHGGNFIKLIENGFYDGLLFHKVKADLIIVAGDPSGTGLGGPGYGLAPETGALPNKKGYIGMMPGANGKTNGSQYYILLDDYPDFDKSTSCFGMVIAGFELARDISRVPAQDEKPIEPIKILNARMKTVDFPPANESVDSTRFQSQ